MWRPMVTMAVLSMALASACDKAKSSAPATSQSATENQGQAAPGEGAPGKQAPGDLKPGDLKPGDPKPGDVEPAGKSIDLPPLDLAMPEEKTRAASVKINNASLKLHRKGEFASAIAGYKEALQLDPGNLLARYNLATASIAAGNVGQGLDVLESFTVADCSACKAILMHARTDTELKGLTTNARFVALTKDVNVSLPPFKKAAKDFEKRWDKGIVAPLLVPYVHPRRAIKIFWDDESQGTTEIYGLAGLSAFIKKNHPKDPDEPEEGIHMEDLKKCTKTCCTGQSYSDVMQVVTEICVKKSVGGVPVVDKITIYPGI